MRRFWKVGIGVHICSVKKAAPRAREALVEAIGQALAAVTAKDAQREGSPIAGMRFVGWRLSPRWG